ncbi:MAG: DUF4394 domain-containing protein [bacterium]|jgi:hypothetical protein|nr:DUF4394 domain-containing protein [Betaproteobacteria bacterium]
MQPAVRHTLHAALLVMAALLPGCAAMHVDGPRPETVFAATRSNQLIRFNSGSPGRIADFRPIIGMQQGEQVVGLDFRPTNGRLYALGTAGQLYVIDPATAIAEAIGPGRLRTLAIEDVGFDFDPQADRIRLVTPGGHNLRLDPDTGLPVDGDPVTPGLQADSELNYAAGEFERGRTPQLAAAAIVHRPAAGNRPATTTQYAIDRRARTLVAQGSHPRAFRRLPADTGQLHTIGPLALDLGDGPLSLDVSHGQVALLCVSKDGRSELYRLDLATAALERLGRIAFDEPVMAIAIAPPPSAPRR